MRKIIVGGIAKLFNKIKKYAVSCSAGVDTSWQGSVLLRDTAFDSPSKREIARQERMKREG